MKGNFMLIKRGCFVKMSCPYYVPSLFTPNPIPSLHSRSFNFTFSSFVFVQFYYYFLPKSVSFLSLHCLSSLFFPCFRVDQDSHYKIGLTLSFVFSFLKKQNLPFPSITYLLNIDEDPPKQQLLFQTSLRCNEVS